MKHDPADSMRRFYRARFNVIALMTIWLGALLYLVLA